VRSFGHPQTDDDIGNVTDWGIHTLHPRRSASLKPVAAGLDGRNRLLSRLLHLDVDTVESSEIVIGLAAVPTG